MKGLEQLKVLVQKNQDPNWVNCRIYRLMYAEDIYRYAYQLIAPKPGNMTPDATGQTIDGFSKVSIQSIIQQIQMESYQFRPVKRAYVPKKNGKLRPLGISSFRDKLVQKVMSLILEAIYDSPISPTFYEHSHGYRPTRGTHTAMKQIKRTFKGANWIIEGDFKSFFDTLDHHVLLNILSKRIKDNRFLNLIWKSLRITYVENGIHSKSKIGSVQGSILSPILANIYLHEMDTFVVEQVIPAQTKGNLKLANKDYAKILQHRSKCFKTLQQIKGQSQEKFENLENEDELIALKTQINETKLPIVNKIQYLNKTLRTLPSKRYDYTMVRYVRYADDWVIAVWGRKELAITILNQLKIKLAKLKLLLHEDKTKISHGKKQGFDFLGFHIRTGLDKPTSKHFINKNGHRVRHNSSSIKITVSMKKLIQKLAENGFCKPDGFPTGYHAWSIMDDRSIITRFLATARGIENAARFVHNWTRLHGSIRYILGYSLAKTLARKYQISVRQVFRKYGKNIKVPKANGKGFIIFRTNVFLYKNTNAFVDNRGNWSNRALPTIWAIRSNSVLDLPCCICHDPASEMHHVRHIRKTGTKLKGFHKSMRDVNKKQIPVCHNCHVKIHQGRYNGLSLKNILVSQTTRVC